MEVDSEEAAAVYKSISGLRRLAALLANASVLDKNMAVPVLPDEFSLLDDCGPDETTTFGLP